MVSSDERREVAERLRSAAKTESGNADYLWNRLEIAVNGWRFGDVIDESYVLDNGVLARLADLIDPTCHAVPSDGGFFTCSERGERIGAVLPALGTVLMHHCSHCGARVVSSGGELHGITGTEIGKYRYVSDNEDGKEG